MIQCSTNGFLSPMVLINVTINVMTKLVIFISIFLSCSIFAESNDDNAIRIKNVNFEIQDLMENNFSYKLINQDNLGLILEKKNKKSFEVFRPSTSISKSLDDQFSKIFVKGKYLTKEYNNQPCELKFKLWFRGDDLSLCSQDKVKVTEVVSFIKMLEIELAKK